MKIKKTWRNLAILLLVLPLRVPCILVLNLLTMIGNAADATCDWLRQVLPGLEADWKAEQDAKEAKLKSELFRVTQQMRKTSCSQNSL